MPAEVLKRGGEALAAVLHAVSEICWGTHRLPPDLKDANIITLYKNEVSRTVTVTVEEFRCSVLLGKF